ncbi:Hypothetical predicted protein [Cloeon dipterum]|uniref:Uncharacterized protein n=1 Tax=Cloeon dipterum TaxID=197152 RepID=A0A8S1DVU6_9INSE|nr:Hypothetical predicted protein [Cloeon dipterum]
MGSRPRHGGILNFEGSLNQLSQLHSAVFGRCCARPQFEQKCIYCSRTIKNFDYPALLPHETNTVPDLCPYHFTVDEPNRIYFREAQDPHKICRFCTASFRVYFHLCRFTRRSPFRIYTVEDLCIALFECCSCAERENCVYCNKEIDRNPDNPLTSEEAEKVPRMCPHHIKLGNPNKINYLKEPQDPQNICQACTIIFRNFIKTCHFTSSTPFRLETHNLRKTQHIIYFKFKMDSMNGNSAVEESSSEGGKYVIQAANKLYSAVMECCAERKKCVYCNNKIDNNLENPLLTSEEAEKVPRMCPHHFKFGSPNKNYFKDPQDPQNICQVCTVIFRNFIKTYNRLTESQHSYLFGSSNSNTLSVKIMEKYASGVFQIVSRASRKFQKCLNSVMCCGLKFKKDPPSPPEEVQTECVYCSSKFVKHDYPLLPGEARDVTKLCPYHFTLGKPDIKYLRVQQDPQLICQVCTSHFRLQSQFCHFTSGTPYHKDENYDKCTWSMSLLPFTPVLPISRLLEYMELVTIETLAFYVISHAARWIFSSRSRRKKPHILLTLSVPSSKSSAALTMEVKVENAGSQEHIREVLFNICISLKQLYPCCRPERTPSEEIKVVVGSQASGQPEHGPSGQPQSGPSEQPQHGPSASDLPQPGHTGMTQQPGFSLYPAQSAGLQFQLGPFGQALFAPYGQPQPGHSWTFQPGFQPQPVPFDRSDQPAEPFDITQPGLSGEPQPKPCDESKPGPSSMTQPELQQDVEKCVYCDKKLKKFDYLLDPQEAKKIPYLCPAHFSMGNPDKKYLKEPQDPTKICPVCTVHFRIYTKMCHFTGCNPGQHDPRCDICVKRMEEAGRLEQVSPSGSRDFHQAVDESLETTQKPKPKPRNCPTHPLSWMEPESLIQINVLVAYWLYVNRGEIFKPRETVKGENYPQVPIVTIYRGRGRNNDSKSPGVPPGLATRNESSYYAFLDSVNEKIVNKFWNIEMTENIFNISRDEYQKVKLPFDFRFYGYQIKEVAVMADGFISMVVPVEKSNFTSYIAPFLAKFNTSAGTNSYVTYFVNETMLTVKWVDMELALSEIRGKFSFQATLFSKDHAIVFSYKEVPADLTSSQHLLRKSGVRIGISDSYENDVPSHTRVSYSNFNLIIPERPVNITNSTVFNFGALPTCHALMDYENCTTVSKESFWELNCTWCPQVKRCSDGFDRERLEWLSNGCAADNDNVS